MNEELRPIDPVSIRLTNGEERKLLLSMGGIRRLKARFGVKKIKDILDRDAEESVPIIYEALIDKAGVTEEQFADLVPANLEETVKIVMRLIGISLPGKPANPPVPAPLNQAIQ